MAIYILKSVSDPSKRLNVSTSGIISGTTNVNLYSDTGSPEQKWNIGSLTNGVIIRSINNTTYALCADPADWNCEVSASSQYNYINVKKVSGTNYYRFQLQKDTSKYLTVAANGVDVSWKSDPESDKQYWALQEVKFDAAAISKLVSAANACIGKNLAACAEYFDVTNPNVAWCAWFCRMCAEKAGMYFGPSNLSYALYGIFGNYSFSSTGIKVGDLAFIDTNGGTSIGHVGIVVEIKNGTIYTVEGNMSGTVQASIVKKASYNLSDGKSQYYGRIVKYGKNSM